MPSTCSSTLDELELYDNLIKHIEGLEDFTEIRSLDLSYNKLKHINNLSTLKKLDHLYFVQNRISKIENLEELTELVYLELGANRVREIAGLETLTKLEHLWLGQNRITELKGLSTLTNLRTLSIQANRLTTLSGIETLPQITELYISDNRIPSLEPLAQNTKLEILDFQSNPISSLAGIEGLKQLENVWASNCEIDSFQEIERALKDKEKLEEVYFEGNPVQKQGPVLYRNKVRLALPQVNKIDAGKFGHYLSITLVEIEADAMCSSVREGNLERLSDRVTIASSTVSRRIRRLADKHISTLSSQRISTSSRSLELFSRIRNDSRIPPNMACPAHVVS